MKSVKSVGQNGEEKSLTPSPSPRGEEEKASPPAPLQGERGGSKLRGCDSQDRAIQTISVKSVKSVGQNGEEVKKPRMTLMTRIVRTGAYR